MPDETVKVAVRCRPPNKKEETEGRKDTVDVNAAGGQVSIRNPADAADVKSFSFDSVYDQASTQKMVYEETAFPLVENVLAGYNGTIFAYGQTGSGKSWSMLGKDEPAELRGIIPNSFDHIFEYIKASAGAREFLCRCSFLELYNEEIRDLLGADPEKRLDLREDPEKGIFVSDLSYVVVDTGAAMEAVLRRGDALRSVGSTAMNAVSSRSHSIFTVVIEASEQRDGKDCITRGKLNLVDLAGSERLNKTGAAGARMKEGIKINLSLTALGNVISALVEGKHKHVPYRDSKLTRLLQDSLGGNTKTVMLAAINAADYNYEETLSTLRYANRAKNIKNKPVVNEDPKDALLRQYKDEIDKLKAMLVAHLAAAGLAPEAMEAMLASMALPPPPGGAGAATKAAAAPANAEESAAAAAATSAAPVDCVPAATGDGEEQLAVGVMGVGDEAGGGPDPVAPLPSPDAVRGGRAAGAGTGFSSSSSSSGGGGSSGGPDAATAAALEAARAEADAARRDREELSAKLAELQHMLIGSQQAAAAGGGNGGSSSGAGASPSPAAAGRAGAAAPPLSPDADPEVLAARAAHEARKAQQRARAARAKECEARLREEAAALAGERAALEEARDELTANAGDNERTLKRVKARAAARIRALERELADARDEWSGVREGLAATVREQNREMRLLEQVVAQFLSPAELGRLWEKSDYDEDADCWVMPRLKPRAGWKTRVASSAAAAAAAGGAGAGAGMRSPGGGGSFAAASSVGPAAWGYNTVNLSARQQADEAEEGGAYLAEDDEAVGTIAGGGGSGALPSLGGTGFGAARSPSVAARGARGDSGAGALPSLPGLGGASARPPASPVIISGNTRGGGGGGVGSAALPSLGRGVGNGASGTGSYAASPVSGGGGGGLPSLSSSAPLPSLGAAAAQQRRRDSGGASAGNPRTAAAPLQLPQPQPHQQEQHAAPPLVLEPSASPHAPALKGRAPAAAAAADAAAGASNAVPDDQGYGADDDWQDAAAAAAAASPSPRTAAAPPMASSISAVSSSTSPRAGPSAAAALPPQHTRRATAAPVGNAGSGAVSTGIAGNGARPTPQPQPPAASRGAGSGAGGRGNAGRGAQQAAAAAPAAAAASSANANAAAAAGFQIEDDDGGGGGAGATAGDLFTVEDAGADDLAQTLPMPAARAAATTGKAALPRLGAAAVAAGPPPAAAVPSSSASSSSRASYAAALGTSSKTTNAPAAAAPGSSKGNIAAAPRAAPGKVAAGGGGGGNGLPALGGAKGAHKAGAAATGKAAAGGGFLPTL